MKNLIYISLIAVALSACKGTSFTKQRYTSFAHTSHKHASKEKPIIKADAGVVNEQSQTIEQTETIPVLVSATNEISREDIILHNIENIPLINTSNTISKGSENIQHSKPIIVKDKKLVKEKSHAAKRILGTLLKIVLWIIILAVVVGILLIIGALA